MEIVGRVTQAEYLVDLPETDARACQQSQTSIELQLLRQAIRAVAS
jgi:hypothetical protein